MKIKTYPIYCLNCGKYSRTTDKETYYNNRLKRAWICRTCAKSNWFKRLIRRLKNGN